MNILKLRNNGKWLAFAIALLLIVVPEVFGKSEEIAPGSPKRSFRTQGNPYLPLWEHVPDGEPRVFEDPDNPGKYRIYKTFYRDTKEVTYAEFEIFSNLK